MNTHGTSSGTDAFIARLHEPVTFGNRIRDANPIRMLVMLASLMAIAIALPGIIPLIVVTALYIALACIGGVGKPYVAALAKLYAVVGVILFVLRAIFLDSGQRLLVFGPFIVSTGGLWHALGFTLLVMALCATLVLFFVLVPVQHLMLALELRGVTPRATYVILASFQAINDLGHHARTVMDAQRSRGIETEGGLFTRVRAFVPVLAPVFLAAMSQADERALALDARGFNGRGARSHLLRLPRAPAAERVLAWLLPALAVAAIVGAATLWR